MALPGVSILDYKVRINPRSTQQTWWRRALVCGRGHGGYTPSNGSQIKCACWCRCCRILISLLLVYKPEHKMDSLVWVIGGWASEARCSCRLSWWYLWYWNSWIKIVDRLLVCFGQLSEFFEQKFCLFKKPTFALCPGVISEYQSLDT